MTIRGKVKKYTGKTKKYRGKMPGKTTIRENSKNIRRKHSEKHDNPGKNQKNIRDFSFTESSGYRFFLL